MYKFLFLNYNQKPVPFNVNNFYFLNIFRYLTFIQEKSIMKGKKRKSDMMIINLY